MPESAQQVQTVITEAAVPVPVPEPAQLAPQPVQQSSKPPAIEFQAHKQAKANANANANALANANADAKAKAKANKRYRPLGPPFHECFHGVNHRKMRVRLDEPEEGDECPLTLGPVAEDALEFLQPTTTWFAAFPNVKRLTLPCGHRFGALNILYHFLRRNMLCPCCRSGLNTRLSAHCVPASFRQALEAKVQRELREDSEEQIEADRAAASSLAQAAAAAADDPFIYVMDLTLVNPLHLNEVSLGVQLYGAEFQAVPLANLSMPLLPRSDGDDPSFLVYFLPPGSVTTILERMLADLSVYAIALSALVDVGDSSVDVASTELIRVDRAANRAVLSPQHGVTLAAARDSSFHLEIHEGFSRIRTLEWRAPHALLASLSLD